MDKISRLNLLVYKHEKIRGRWAGLYECSCGVKKAIINYTVKSGKSCSCGCLKNELSANRIKEINKKRHPDPKKYNPLYSVWKNIKTRCKNKNSYNYHNYGGRGIKLCDEWENFEKFAEDMSSGYRKGLQIDRIDNNKGYLKDNCRWVTVSDNCRNKRGNVIFNGECAVSASRKLSGSDGLIYNRILRGWKIEDAFSMPARRVIRR